MVPSTGDSTSVFRPPNSIFARVRTISIHHSIIERKLWRHLARGRRGSQSGRQHAGGGGARTTGMEERAIHTGGTPSPRHSPVARGRWRVTTPLLLLRRREPPTSTSGAPLLLTTMPTTCLARATCLAWSAVGLGLRFRRM